MRVHVCLCVCVTVRDLMLRKLFGPTKEGVENFVMSFNVCIPHQNYQDEQIKDDEVGETYVLFWEEETNVQTFGDET